MKLSSSLCKIEASPLDASFVFPINVLAVYNFFLILDLGGVKSSIWRAFAKQVLGFKYGDMRSQENRLVFRQ